MPAFMAGRGARRRGRLSPPPGRAQEGGWLPWSQMSCSTAVRLSGEIQPQAAAHREAAPSDPTLNFNELHHSQCKERSEFSSMSCEVIDPKLVNNHQNYLPPPARPPTARCLHAVPTPSKQWGTCHGVHFYFNVVTCSVSNTRHGGHSEQWGLSGRPLTSSNLIFYAWNVIAL